MQENVVPCEENFTHTSCFTRACNIVSPINKNNIYRTGKFLWFSRTYEYALNCVIPLMIKMTLSYSYYIFISS